MTTARVDLAALEVLYRGTPSARVDLVALEIIRSVPSTPFPVVIPGVTFTVPVTLTPGDINTGVAEPVTTISGKTLTVAVALLSGSLGATVPGRLFLVPVTLTLGDLGVVQGATIPGKTFTVPVTLSLGALGVVQSATIAGKTFTVPVTLSLGSVGTGATIPGKTFTVPVTLALGALDVAQSATIAGKTFTVPVTLSLGGVSVTGLIDGETFAIPLEMISGGLVLRQRGKLMVVSLSLAPGDTTASSNPVMTPGLINFGLTFSVATAAPGEDGEDDDGGVVVDPGETLPGGDDSGSLDGDGGDLVISLVPLRNYAGEEWNVIKGTARRIVHDYFAVEAIHEVGGVNGQRRAVKVRWHVRGNKLLGDLQGQGYGEVIAAVDRMVFNTEQLALVGITKLQRGDRITIPSLNNTTFVLDAMDPSDGPITQTWEVQRA